jgi:hypothetical protein
VHTLYSQQDELPDHSCGTCRVIAEVVLSELLLYGV